MVLASADVEEQSEAKALTLQPWQVNPFELVSWWEMEKFSAVHFYGIGVVLEKAHHQLGIPPGGDPAFTFGTPTMTDKEEIDLASFLQSIQGEAEKIGLELSIQRSREIHSEIASHPRVAGGRIPRARVAALLSELDNLLRLEMSRKLFMYIPSEREKF